MPDKSYTKTYQVNKMSSILAYLGGGCGGVGGGNGVRGDGGSGLGGGGLSG